MSTIRYAVQHYADRAMTMELGEPRFTSHWGRAWDEMHCHKRPVPTNLVISTISRIQGETRTVLETLSRR